MLSTERSQFEAELEVLFGAFPSFLTDARKEAYWRGLQKMQLPTFMRCVQHVLGENCPDKVPTLSMIWRISRNLRVPARALHAPAEQVKPDAFFIAGNTWLFGFLLRKGGTSAESLSALIALKNRIVEDFRQSGDVCDSRTNVEWRDLAHNAFEKHWREPTADEVEAACERYTRTHSL